MITKSKLVIAVIATALLTSAVLLLPNKTEETEKVAAAPQNPIAPIRNAISISVETNRSPLVVDQTPPLAAAYAKSRNYREFIEGAREKLTSGGGAYATAAQIKCASANKLLAITRSEPLPQDNRLIAQLAESRTLLESRCGGLSDNDTGDLVSRQLRKQGTASQDPILRMQSEIVIGGKQANLESQTSVVQEMLKLSDPLTFDLFGDWLIGLDKSGNGFFDGEIYTGTDALALLSATQLLPCDFGADCGRTSNEVASACVFNQICVENKADLIGIQAAQYGYSLATVLALHEKLLAAVQAGRVNAFVKPRGA